MPLFITYASYSQSGAKGLIDKPADRSGVIKALIEKAGGKLIALYFTTGSNDVGARFRTRRRIGCSSVWNGCIGKWLAVQNRNRTRLDVERIQRHRGKRLPRLPALTLRPENDEQCTA